MYSQFAHFFETLTYQRIYAQHYQTRAKHINTWITGTSTISTAGSIAGWSLWDTYPSIWACVIAASQIVQVIKPLMPFSKRIVSLSGYIHEANNFAYEVESRWNRFMSGDPITAEELCFMKTKLEALENKFFSGDEIPSIKSISQRTADETALYLQAFGFTQPISKDGDYLGKDTKAAGTEYAGT